MSVPLLVIGGVVAILGLVRKCENDKNIEASTSPKSPGNSYALPACCIVALKTASNRGTLMASIGATIASSNEVQKIAITKASTKSVEKTAKSGNDVGTIVVMDWDKEATLHVEFFQGVEVLTQTTMFKVVQEHYAVHATENDTDPQKFWTKLYERKRSKLKYSNLKRAEEISESPDVTGRPSSR